MHDGALMDINIYKNALRVSRIFRDFVTSVNGGLQHEQRKRHNQSDKRECEQREEPQAIKRNLHIPKEKATPPLFGLADFRLAIGADIPHLVAVADRQIAFHRGHPDFIVKFFMAN